MSLSLKRTSVLVAVAALLFGLLAVSGTRQAEAADDVRTYRVTVENLTENQLLTPAVVATHDGQARLFRAGKPASNGIQQLAENGGVPVLADEVAARNGVSDVAVAGAAPLAPGESAEVIITAGPGTWRLSAAAMLICTNDGFGGASRLTLPRGYGETRAVYGVAYDAGTEMNTEDYDDLVPPCDGMGQTGESDPALAQDGVITRHRGIKGTADLTSDHDWNDPVIKVSAERVNVYDVTVENLTSGQLQTPFAFATHRLSTSVFESGEPASNGVQQAAENGDLPTLVGELHGAYKVGAVEVIGAAPIAPGATANLQIVAPSGFGRASLVGMLICTNDGFAGVDSIALSGMGETMEYLGDAYDAGTEMNTEDYDDLVPPCDGMGQTGATNPALAEGGVVGAHAGIIGGADLLPGTHGWTDPVVKVTITRTG